jgi:predicted membrane protein
MGSLRVDLTEITDLEDDVTITVSVGIGEAVVVLPEGVGARVDASVGIGEVSVLDRSRGGVGVSVEEEVAGTPSIDLEVSAGIGRVEVTR